MGLFHTKLMIPNVFNINLLCYQKLAITVEINYPKNYDI